MILGNSFVPSYLRPLRNIPYMACSNFLATARGIPKWRDKATGKLLAESRGRGDELAVQVAFCARFDRAELSVEGIRYFHDDDAVSDPFDDEVVQTVPSRLLGELGFFLVPAHRTWDKLVSFNSELFRRILDSKGALEATEILAERDRLRRDDHRVDMEGSLKELREGITTELQKLLPGEPSLELRLTGTDSESLLYALVPHYRFGTSVSLPAARHGSGLLSLQTALLVLQIAERRLKAKQNVIIAVEEPELHMPRACKLKFCIGCGTHLTNLFAPHTHPGSRPCVPRSTFAS